MGRVGLTLAFSSPHCSQIPALISHLSSIWKSLGPCTTSFSLAPLLSHSVSWLQLLSIHPQSRSHCLTWSIDPTAYSTSPLQCLMGISNLTCPKQFLIFPSRIPLLRSFPSRPRATPSFQLLKPSTLESSSTPTLSLRPHIWSIGTSCWLSLKNISRIQPLTTSWLPLQSSTIISCKKDWKRLLASPRLQPLLNIEARVVLLKIQIMSLLSLKLCNGFLPHSRKSLNSYNGLQGPAKSSIWDALPSDTSLEHLTLHFLQVLVQTWPSVMPFCDHTI